MSQGPDHSRMVSIQKNLKAAARRLQKLAPMVGRAKQIKEFNSDQRKNILAATQLEYIQRGESVAGSETMARANPTYLERLKTLEKSLEDAEATIAQWQADFAYYESCRSLMAMEREVMRTLDG